MWTVVTHSPKMPLWGWVLMTQDGQVDDVRGRSEWQAPVLKSVSVVMSAEHLGGSHISVGWQQCVLSK